MGIFRRINKEVKRQVESNNRSQEFENTLKIVMEGFDASRNPQNPNFTKANTPEYKKNLLKTSEQRREDATRLNLHGYAAMYSSIHCRTFLDLHQDELLGLATPQVVFGRYGCRELHSLHSDIRYLAWGVSRAGVDPHEYWECKGMVDLYQSRIILFAMSKLKSGKLEIIDDFVSPPIKETVDWINYESMLKPNSALITPTVPPLQ
jgi:hypothetical protein